MSIVLLNRSEGRGKRKRNFDTDNMLQRDLPCAIPISVCCGCDIGEDGNVGIGFISSIVASPKLCNQTREGICEEAPDDEKMKTREKSAM